MKRLALSLVAALGLTMGLNYAASAYDWTTMNVGQNNVYTSTTQLPLVAISDCNSEVNCEDFACDSCDDCCAPVFFAETDWLVLKYYRADGLRVGADSAAEQINGSYESAPRLTYGYITAGGLGARLRYFEFDQTMVAIEGAPSRLDINTYTVDAELFERFALNAGWDLEASLGARYVEFSEGIRDGDELRDNRFHGFGAIAGLELRRQVALGAMYGRVRQSILADDKFRSNFSFALPPGSGTQILLDSVVGITEINIGYELTRDLANGAQLYGRIGGEYQLWSNFSSNFTPGTADAEGFWTGSSDVGFAGVSFTVGLQY